MGTGNKCIVCLTKYGLVAVGFIAVIIVLAYLMITTPWRAIIAVVIPPAAAAALAIATDRIRPRDCAAIFILFLGYFNAAMAYILLYIKAGGHAAYFYYAIFIATMLSYIAVVASITC